jgi:hypothetical protein
MLRAVTENEGKDLLEARFTRAGYQIVRDCRFAEGGIVIDLDGWDASARVGYEYITREAGDDRQFDPETVARLEQRMQNGELALLLIDEREAVTAAALEAAADGFLAELAKQHASGGRAAP